MKTPGRDINVITKTPEEIKRGLAACMTDGGCTVCPYHSMVSGAKCIPAMSSDAFAYVQELESRLTQDKQALPGISVGVMS